MQGRQGTVQTTAIWSVILAMVFSLGVSIVSSMDAEANSEGNAVLAKVQDNITVSGDKVSIQTMRLIDESGNERVRLMKSYERGQDTMLIVFEEPAGVKGVSLLSLPDKSIYLYMPAFGRVRRIASHIRNQDFMGTDFSYEDLSFNYTDNYDVVTHDVDRENAHYLVLRPKAGSDISYSSVSMWIDANYVPTRLEFIEADGTVTKRMLVKAKQHDEHWEMATVEMEKISTKHKTIVELSEVNYQPDLEPNFFSARNLRRIGR